MWMPPPMAMLTQTPMQTPMPTPMQTPMVTPMQTLMPMPMQTLMIEPSADRRGVHPAECVRRHVHHDRLLDP